jgi:tripeptide aminopeptidase
MIDIARTLIERTIELVAIPAPTFEEKDRMEHVRKWWIEDGITAVSVDDQGNLVGCLRAGTKPEAPVVLVCAHLDTVFSREVVHATTWDGTRLIGPSVADDSVATATLSLLGQCLSQEVDNPVWIAATTAEEGLGNLAGVTYLLENFARSIHVFVALEGNYFGRVNVTGVGSVRGRVKVTGPGGHSWEEPGNPSAVESSARCVQRIVDDSLIVDSQTDVKSTVNVGRITGGESINSRAITCTFDIEARSEDPIALSVLEQMMRTRIDELKSSFEVEWTDLGRRPAGGIDVDHPVVRIAAKALEESGVTPTLSAASTDANAAYARSIPAITLGVVFGGNTHTEDEWIDTASLEAGFRTLCITVERLATEGW